MSDFTKEIEKEMEEEIDSKRKEYEKDERGTFFTR